MLIRKSVGRNRILPLWLVLLGIALTFDTALTQQQMFVTWSDGDSLFTDLDSTRTRAVRVDSVVELLSTSATVSEADTFLLFLNGVDAEFNNVNKAVVVDFNGVDGLELYIVTDASAGRVFAIRSDGVEVTEIKGEPGTPEELSSPASARIFLEGFNRKVLVTDRGSNRVLKFDVTTKFLEYVYPPADEGFEQLTEPSASVPVPNRQQIVICDTRNNRILLIDTSTDSTVWTVGPSLPNDVALNRPVDVEWVGGAEDEVLITDRSNHRVLRFNQTQGAIVWQFGKTGQAALSDSTLRNPEDAQLLANGNVLITDAGNNRLIEVDQNGTIVWRYLRSLPGLRSAWRLTDGRTLVISDNELLRLGYSTRMIESGIGDGKLNLVHDLRRNVAFDSLKWQFQLLPAGTGARFQLRSSDNFGDLAIAEFLGPTGPNSYYATSPAVLNSAHTGDRFYDFRVELATDNYLNTPILNQVMIDYHFFESDSTGLITTPVIRDSGDVLVSRWENLTFTTEIPADPLLRDDVPMIIRILEAAEDRELLSFTANLNTPANVINLAQFTALRGVQALRLQAVLQTNNSSVSPVLKDWSITWQRTPPADAEISFTDAVGIPIPGVRTDLASVLGPNPPRNVFIQLLDGNILPLKDTVNVKLRALRSGDFQTVTLERQGTGAYTFPIGLPAVITNTAIAENGRIEVVDRDTLVVRYVDPFTPEDIAIDSALVLQFTTGVLQVMNQDGLVLTGDTDVTFKDSLFLDITGERDRDFSPAQDTIFASLLDRNTNDFEEIMLLELPDASGPTFTTGDFRSPTGTPLTVGQNGVRNDGRLQTLGNNEIVAQYIDNVTLEVILQMEADTTGGGPFIGTAADAFNFLLGPNPYRASNGSIMRMRMEAITGGLRLLRIEVYNFAGERLRTLDAQTLSMDRGTDIPARSISTTRTQWWDLRAGSSSGPLVSSGTYWAKFIAVFTDDLGNQREVSSLRKFVIVQ